MQRASLKKPFVALVLHALLNVAVWGQATVSPNDPPTVDLTAKIAAMVAEPAVSHAHFGVMVTSMDGTPIVTVNEGQNFQPASNTKLFTTAAALALLKSGTRFETRVLARGTVAAGTLNGDLILKGDGDPNISGRTVPYVEPAAHPTASSELPPLHLLDQMVDQVAATGLKKIDGDIVGDDTLFPWQPYAPDWSFDDLLWGYGAPASALTLNDNQLKLIVSPGSRSTPARVGFEPESSYYAVQNEVVTTPAKSRSAVEVERLPGSRALRLYGTIAEDSAPFVEEIAIEDPALFAAQSLKQRLEGRGITITGKAIAHHREATSTAGFLEQARTPLVAGSTAAPCLRCTLGQASAGDAALAAHTSATVGEDVVVTNKESQNLHAELLLHQLGAALGADGSTAQGARVVRQFLLDAGIAKDDFVFYDGSGMSGHNLVTPRAIAKLLQYATTQPWFAEYKSSLPVGGVDGTLEARFTKPPLKGHVFAKTGTSGESRALSGYLECASGRIVIFSILVGNHAPGTSADRDVMDRVVAAIAAAN